MNTLLDVLRKDVFAIYSYDQRSNKICKRVYPYKIDSRTYLVEIFFTRVWKGDFQTHQFGAALVKMQMSDLNFEIAIKNTIEEPKYTSLIGPFPTVNLIHFSYHQKALIPFKFFILGALNNESLAAWLPHEVLMKIVEVFDMISAKWTYSNEGQRKDLMIRR